MFGRKCWVEGPLSEHSAKKYMAECSTRFPRADSFYDNRLFLCRKDVLQISTHCLEAFAPEVVRSEEIPSCPNLEPKIRSLGLIRPNLQPIYHPRNRVVNSVNVRRFLG